MSGNGRDEYKVDGGNDKMKETRARRRREMEEKKAKKQKGRSLAFDTVVRQAFASKPTL